MQRQWRVADGGWGNYGSKVPATAFGDLSVELQCWKGGLCYIEPRKTRQLKQRNIE